MFFGGIFEVVDNKNRLATIQAKLAKPDIWNSPELASILHKKNILTQQLEQWEALVAIRIELDEWLKFAYEDQSQEVLTVLDEHLTILAVKIESAELAVLLTAPEDKYDAIVSIHSGAGGIEAQNWAAMLLRMYKRWAESLNYNVKYLDYIEIDETDLKSVTISIKGMNAYGLLRGETGIHRLIRISPYDASGRRHTSFASVDVLADVVQNINIIIREEDLRIDVFRSSGPGGQSVNTTSSAVRVTHLPTGIIVQCQNEKSQFRNKESAMKILKARLYNLELKKIADLKKKYHDKKEIIAWGSQIRTYTLQPYRLVKDHRTKCEIVDVDAVLNGCLDKLIRAYLFYRHAQKK